MYRLIALAIAIMTLGGCALFSTPASVPVVEDEVGSGRFSLENDNRIGTLATVAQRRLALIRFKDGKFCAEPPPDAADNISATLSTALSGSSGNVQANAQLVASIASVAKQLFYRSQGLQLYRDGSFALCNAYLNGTINDAVFQSKQAELLETAKALIAQEIPYLEKIKADPIGSPASPNPSTPNPSEPAPGAPTGGGTTPR